MDLMLKTIGEIYRCWI